MKLDRPLASIDLETSGVDPVKDRIVSVGVTVLHPDGTVNPRGWSRLFNPGIPIPEAATAIHGISDADVKDCPPFSSFAAAFHQRLAGKDLLFYNGRRLDIPLLDQEFRRCGLKLDLTDVRVVDAQAVYFKREERNLAAAVRRYCGREPEGSHGAGVDSADTLDVLLGQLKEYEDLATMSLDELAAYTIMGEHLPVDFAGKFYRDSDGFLCYNFGNSKDRRVQQNPGFANWMLSKDFPGNTLDCLREELDRLAAL